MQYVNHLGVFNCIVYFLRLLEPPKKQKKNLHKKWVQKKVSLNFIYIIMKKLHTRRNVASFQRDSARFERYTYN